VPLAVNGDRMKAAFQTDVKIAPSFCESRRSAPRGRVAARRSSVPIVSGIAAHPSAPVGRRCLYHAR